MPFYIKSDDSAYPIIDISGPYYAVYKIETENGQGEFLPQYYYWEGAKKHRLGNGFLGFTGSTHRTDAIHTLDKNEFIPDTQYCFLKPEKAFSLNTACNNDTINQVEYLDSLITFGSKRIFRFINSTTSINNLILTKQISEYDYDSVGNLIYAKTILINTEGDSSVIEAVNSTTNIFQSFGNFGIPNKVTSITDSSTYMNETPYVRSRAFTYDSLGRELTGVIDPNKTKAVTTTYSDFNGFGTPSQVTITSSVTTSRQTSFEYDPKGRFITGITDPSNNHITKRYYPSTGNLKSETDLNNQTVTYLYDSLGRNVETITPQGEHITTSIDWNERYIEGAGYSLYMIKSESPDSLYQSHYFDHLGRELLSETFNITGIILKTKLYNSSGQLFRESLPYFSTESYGNIKWKKYSYDYFGRIEKDSLSAQSYTNYSYNGKTTTLTRGNDYEKAIRTNSLGQKVYSNDLGSVVTTTYLSNGQPKNMNADGTVVSFYYDEYGRQDSVVNPNSGRTKYEYNAFGELTEQEDANGLTTSLQYDISGRLQSKTNNEGTTSYNYVQDGYGKGQIQRITGPEGISKVSKYDVYGRTIRVTDSIPGDQSFSTSYTYDTRNKLTSITYPSGFCVSYVYQNGLLKEIKNGNSNIWTADSVNAPGQPLQSEIGPGSLIERFTYNYYGSIRTKRINGGIQYFTMDPLKGLLLDRSIRIPGQGLLTETFDYDNRNRLNQSYGDGLDTIEISYDSRGNIINKTGIGTYEYNGVRINQLENISPDSLYIQNHNQRLTYNSDNLTTEINQEEVDTLCLQLLYNPLNQRIKSILLDNGDTTKIKYYSGNYEKVIEGYEIRQYNYIYCPYGLIAVNIDFGESDTTYYVETDHLGSIIGLLRSDGLYIEKYSYDPWGRRRNPVTWTYDSITLPALIDRGFTGHEHLDEFGLINMNGRMYDPYIGRFLGVDPIIQFIGNSQSYNGYGYCLNNPLKYTDPSGYMTTLMMDPTGTLGFQDFNNNMFDISSRWINEFWNNYPLPGGGGAHPDGSAGWDRSASSRGMLGYREDVNGNMIDNVTGEVVKEKSTRKESGHWEKVYPKSYGKMHYLTKINSKKYPFRMNNVPITYVWVWDIKLTNSNTYNKSFIPALTNRIESDLIISPSLRAVIYSSSTKSGENTNLELTFLNGELNSISIYTGPSNIMIGLDGSTSIGMGWLSVGFDNMYNFTTEISLPTGFNNESGISLTINKWLGPTAVAVGAILIGVETALSGSLLLVF